MEIELGAAAAMALFGSVLALGMSIRGIIENAHDDAVLRTETSIFVVVAGVIAIIAFALRGVGLIN